MALATKTKWRQPRVHHLMTGHTLGAYPLSPEGRESVPMVARPPCDAAGPVAASLRAWGACGEGRHREESVVCLSVGGLVGRLTRGHQETGGLDVYCILTV